MEIITSIFAELLATGPMGLVAAMELLAIIALSYALWGFIKKRNEQVQLVEAHSGEMQKLQATHTSKTDELHDTHQKQLAALNAERIGDIKEASEDYAELAEKNNEILNRLTIQLEVRGGK